MPAAALTVVPRKYLMYTFNARVSTQHSYFDDPPPRSLSPWLECAQREAVNEEVRMFILIHILTLISPQWKCSSPETIMTLIWPLGMSLFC